MCSSCLHTFFWFFVEAIMFRFDVKRLFFRPLYQLQSNWILYYTSSSELDTKMRTKNIINKPNNFWNIQRQHYDEMGYRTIKIIYRWNCWFQLICCDWWFSRLIACKLKQKFGQKRSKWQVGFDSIKAFASFSYSKPFENWTGLNVQIKSMQQSKRQFELFADTYASGTKLEFCKINSPPRITQHCMCSSLKGTLKSEIWSDTA